MNSVDVLTIQIHGVIRTLRHICTGLSVVFAVPALTVIFVCEKKVSRRYSMLLGSIVSLGIVMDLVIQLVWDPIVLLPALCIVRENPPIPLPGDANVYYELSVQLITLNIPLFGACFLERHQAVQNPGTRWLLSMRMRHFLIGLLASIVCTISASLMESYLNVLRKTFFSQLAEMSADSEQILIQSLAERWPTVDVARAKCYDRFLFICMGSVSIGGLVLCGALTTLLTFHTLATLRVASTLSEKAKHKNISLIRDLIIQASFPFALIMFPLFFSLVAVIANVGGPLVYSLSYLFISIHSPTHSIILLTVTPIYRKKIVETFHRFVASIKNNQNFVLESDIKNSSTAVTLNRAS